MDQPVRPVDPEARANMRALCATAGGPSTAAGWDILWREGLTLWDLNGPTPALADEIAAALASGNLRPGARALVPGCGAAYDVIALARDHGLDATGVDIVPAAIEKARALASGTRGVTLLIADFFDASALPSAPFDFIFDYTFFCAIAPSQRKAWGERMGELLAPGGRLLTFAFPLDDDEKAADPNAAGPPHPVSIAAYEAALAPAGLRIVDGPRRAERSVRPSEMVVWWERA
jgi:SAM-dependent methyltransferase